MILDYINSIDFRQQSKEGFSKEDTKHYFKQLIQALDFMHSKGVMHLDIKSSNILINNSTRELTLIDFGLSEFYKEGDKMPDDSYPFYYRPPDLFLGNTNSGPDAEVWAAGCMFAQMLFKKVPFIKGQDDDEQLFMIAKTFGSREIINYAKTNKIVIPNGVLMDLKQTEDHIELKKYVTKKNRALIDDLSLDLLTGMMRPNPA